MKAKQLYFLLIGLVAFSIVSIGLVFYVFNTRLSKTIGDISKREEDIAIAELELKSLDELEKDLRRVESIKSAIDAALPKGKSQSDIVAQILDIANSNGIKFRTISFEATEGLPAENSQTKPGTVVPSVSTVPVTLETNNVNYDSLKNFLNDVLAIRRNANVAILNVTRNDESPGKVNARIVIDIHLEKVATALTDEEKAKRRQELEQQTKEEE